jgi:uncharacterized membrane protein
MMPSFDTPAWALFVLPVALLAWRTRSGAAVTQGLRLCLLLLLALALAGPRWEQSARGLDLVVVVDRSLSVGGEADSAGLELVRLAEDARGPGDRVAVVAFAAEARIESLPDFDQRLQRLSPLENREGSDLAQALERAAELVPASRPGAILLASDGYASDSEALDASARRLAARGIRVFTRELARSGAADLAVERIELPERVEVGQAFQFAVWVRADAATRRDFQLRRGERLLSSGLRDFPPGLTRLVFRDVLTSPGVAAYEAAAAPPAGGPDRFPENDRGLGALAVDGPARVLCLTSDGSNSSLTNALASAGIQLVVTTPEAAQVDALLLTGFRTVVLENVDASRVGMPGLMALADFVEERGGGLLLTGGRASFGRGGYFRSPLDPLLPVSMELRREQRKFGVALGIALDRSGSMSAPVGNLTKMDLANEGTAAAIETLDYLDHVTVFAVDSAAHVVQPLTPVDNRGAILGRVRGIRSQGGGIYVLEALEATWRELAQAPQSSRHLLLFADAADAESQAGCLAFVAKHLSDGLGLSVIALGSASDSDAAFLEDLARAGGGSAHFAANPADLPRLFAQEVLTISRASFVEEATGTQAAPGLLGLGDAPSEPFPPIAGYNLTYLRPAATLAAVTTDAYNAPLLAYAYRGLGRTAAYTGQIGGEYGADIVAWPGFRATFSALVRFLEGLEPPNDLFASARVRGNSVSLRLELGNAAAFDATAPGELNAPPAGASPAPTAPSGDGDGRPTPAGDAASNRPLDSADDTAAETSEGTASETTNKSANGNRSDAVGARTNDPSDPTTSPASIAASTDSVSNNATALPNQARPAGEASAGQAALLEATILEPDGTRRRIPLERTGALTFEAQLPLTDAGIRLGTLQLADGRFLDLPPIALPYSSEFSPQSDPDAGRRTLARLAEATGGQALASADQLFKTPVTGTRSEPLLRPLLLFALLLFLLEIAGRRLSLWSNLEARLAALKPAGRSQDVAAARRPAPGVPQTDPKLPVPAASGQPTAEPRSPTSNPPQSNPASSAPAAGGQAPASPPGTPGPANPDLASALDAARRRAGRRMH